MKILHLSDCHLGDNRQEIKSGYAPYDSLQQVINLVMSCGIEYDVIVVSGDISQKPTPSSYHLFQQLISVLGKPVLAVPGNHDVAEQLQRVVKTSPTEDICYQNINGTLFLLINSQVIGQQHGLIKESDLNEMRKILTENSDKFAVIVVHHPPVATDSIWMDNIGLKNKKEFIRILTSFLNAKIVLFGHVHQEIDIELQQLRVLGTPSTCYQFTPKTATTEYDNKNPGFRTIELKQNGEIETSVHRLQ